MIRTLLTRAGTGGLDFRLLTPLLLNTLMVQVAIAIIRVTTSYRAIELGLPVGLARGHLGILFGPAAVSRGVGRPLHRPRQ